MTTKEAVLGWAEKLDGVFAAIKAALKSKDFWKKSVTVPVKLLAVFAAVVLFLTVALIAARRAEKVVTPSLPTWATGELEAPKPAAKSPAKTVAVIKKK